MSSRSTDFIRCGCNLERTTLEPWMLCSVVNLWELYKMMWITPVRRAYVKYQYHKFFKKDSDKSPFVIGILQYDNGIWRNACQRTDVCLKFFQLHIWSNLNPFVKIFKVVFSLANIWYAVLLGVNEKAIDVLCRMMTRKHKWMCWAWCHLCWSLKQATLLSELCGRQWSMREECCSEVISSLLPYLGKG